MMNHEKKQKILRTKVILGLIFIAVILGAFWIALVYSKNLVVEYTIEEIVIENLEQPVQEELVYEKKIYRTGRSMDDPRQEIIQETYKQGGMDGVILFECENSEWKIDNNGDGGKAIGLCQMNENYHKLPDQYYYDRRFQIEYCLEKRAGGTLFYGPDRKDENTGEKCMSFAKRRFYFK